MSNHQLLKLLAISVAAILMVGCSAPGETSDPAKSFAAERAKRQAASNNAAGNPQASTSGN